MSEIGTNLAVVEARVGAAAARVGRSVDEVTLIAVTKTWPSKVLAAAYEAGLRHFGENRTTELAPKQAEMEMLLGPDHDIIWHFIGLLQSRQTGVVAEYAHTFHALDRMKIAQRLSKQLVANGRSERSPLPLFVEVNVSGEASKSGFDCENWENDATQRDSLRIALQTVQTLPGLQLQGLMTMAPWGAAETTIRTVFKRTRALGDWLNTVDSTLQIASYSMGMSDDFEIAIEEGATHIRVGRALFGARH